MNVHRLTRRTGDYSFILRFFGQTGRLEGDSRICIFDELKERTGMLDEMGWNRFFSQVQDTLGWSTFISILLKEVGWVCSSNSRNDGVLIRPMVPETSEKRGPIPLVPLRSSFL
jgi:hypothetical protein